MGKTYDDGIKDEDSKEAPVAGTPEETTEAPQEATPATEEVE